MLDAKRTAREFIRRFHVIHVSPIHPETHLTSVPRRNWREPILFLLRNVILDPLNYRYPKPKKKRNNDRSEQSADDRPIVLQELRTRIEVIRSDRYDSWLLRIADETLTYPFHIEHWRYIEEKMQRFVLSRCNAPIPLLELVLL